MNWYTEDMALGHLIKYEINEQLEDGVGKSYRQQFKINYAKKGFLAKK